MKILTADQIRKLDEYTIKNEPIASIDLMERAAGRCTEWLWKNIGEKGYSFFCGTGNNGGDGLAIARMLAQSHYDCEVYVLGNPRKASEDFTKNMLRLEETKCRIYFLNEESHLFSINGKNVIVDAIFGSGLNRPVEGWRAHVIENLNQLEQTRVSVDIPSGLFADPLEPQNNCCFKADYTLTFQLPKRSFLFPENEDRVGRVVVLDIGLSRKFHDAQDSEFHFTDLSWIKKKRISRSVYSHKGTFGHLLIAGGSKGKIGAVVMTAQGALRTGAGLVTALIPEAGYTIFQLAVPQAMCIAESENVLEKIHNSIEASVIALGPGMGTESSTQQAMGEFLKENNKPLVIDADGLNILAKNPGYLDLLPPNSILTPHPKEFDRIFGDHDSHFKRLITLKEESKKRNIVMVLKGAYTRVATPDGNVFFNSTGNPGMATGGTGDTLTGIIAGLLSQKYDAYTAAVMGVYIHGKAADLALNDQSQESLLATDIPNYIGKVFKEVNEI